MERAVDAGDGDCGSILDDGIDFVRRNDHLADFLPERLALHAVKRVFAGRGAVARGEHGKCIARQRGRVDHRWHPHGDDVDAEGFLRQRPAVVAHARAGLDDGPASERWIVLPMRAESRAARVSSISVASIPVMPSTPRAMAR